MYQFEYTPAMETDKKTKTVKIAGKIIAKYTDHDEGADVFIVHANDDKIYHVPCSSLVGWLPL